jgi:nucleoside-diphosphate-sugar epimerase
MRVLVTGAPGFLGSRIAAELRRTTDAELVLWSRRAGTAMDGATWVAGDLESRDPFADVDSTGITHIVHGASVIRFNVDADLAQRVNVDGTRRLLEFAERCPDLRHVQLLSTVYASGLAEGRMLEVPAKETRFANHYESSKCAAEQLLAADFAHLPWSVARICTVIADGPDGAVTQQNAVHNTLSLLYFGLLSMIPGGPDTPLYFVDGAFASRAVARLLMQPDSRGVYHIAPRVEQSPTMAQLLDDVFEVYASDESFARRRVMRPLPCDYETFRMLAEAAGSTGGLLGEALGSVAPFARQLFVHKDIANDRLREAIGETPGDSRSLIRAVCARLLESRFGRAGSNRS